MNYTQDQYKTRIIHTWCGLYHFGTKFFKNLLQNMKNKYVHLAKVSNNCHKTDHISGPTGPRIFMWTQFLSGTMLMMLIYQLWLI
jgi:hypothetical protein